MLPITVYYDGLCPLCSREIAHYRTKVGDAPVAFVDIMGPEFDPVPQGIDPARARQVLHVQVGPEMRTGIDAAIAMWEAIPAYRWLARLTRLPGIHGVANIGYRVFAGFRPYLRRGGRHKCDSGVCVR
jgi:predicted DCC family thiol-disulfide oxidoreductase YuxK